MAKEIRVSKIEVEMGKKVVPLTLEQAKELRDALNALFGSPIGGTTIIYRDRYHDRWPYVTWESPRTTFWCGDTSVSCDAKNASATVCLSSGRDG